MSELRSYIAESCVDLSIRGFGNLEGILNFCKDNGLALDHEEISPIARLIDDVRKQELITNRPLFPAKPTQKKVDQLSYTGQNLVDLALQETGSVEGFVALLRENGFSPEDDPITGTLIKINSSDIVDASIRDFYKSRLYIVNTGKGDTAPVISGGIGFMIIEDTFIVG